MNDAQLRTFVTEKANELEAMQKRAPAATAREFLLLAFEHVYLRGKNDGLAAAQQVFNEAREAVRK